MGSSHFDVVIVGGGPAGLSAALMLGRCQRQVLVLDSEEPRNGVSPALHGYLTQDGVSPLALRAQGRRDLARYPGIAVRTTVVTDARTEAGGFRIETSSGPVHSRLLLLATGRVDPLPEIPGFETFFGRGVYHCPYCDGWEHRGRTLAVFGRGPRARNLASLLLTWSPRILLCTDGTLTPPEGPQPALPAGIECIPDRVHHLAGSARRLREIHFAGSRPPVPCDALFFCSDCAQRSSLPAKLGCQFDPDESVLCRNHAAIGVPGLYVAGNVRGGVHLAITAAAEGAEAAIVMNEALLGNPRPLEH